MFEHYRGIEKINVMTNYNIIILKKCLSIKRCHLQVYFSITLTFIWSHLAVRLKPCLDDQQTGL
jgi:hypothetical protein